MSFDEAKPILVVPLPFRTLICSVAFPLWSFLRSFLFKNVNCTWKTTDCKSFPVLPLTTWWRWKIVDLVYCLDYSYEIYIFSMVPSPFKRLDFWSVVPLQTVMWTTVYGLMQASVQRYSSLSSKKYAIGYVFWPINKCRVTRTGDPKKILKNILSPLRLAGVY